VEGGRRRLFCFAMQSALARGGKKLAADVAGDERGAASLRSDPCQSRSRMERPSREIGGIRQWRPSLARHGSRTETVLAPLADAHHPDPRRHGPSSALGETYAHAALFPHHCGMIRARRCRTSTRAPPPRCPPLMRTRGVSRPIYVSSPHSSAAARSSLASVSWRLRPAPW
jgi:hypothetical protein